jgi:hypothetical protein
VCPILLGSSEDSFFASYNTEKRLLPGLALNLAIQLSSYVQVSARYPAVPDVSSQLPSVPSVPGSATHMDMSRVTKNEKRKNRKANPALGLTPLHENEHLSEKQGSKNKGAKTRALTHKPRVTFGWLALRLIREPSNKQRANPTQINATLEPSESARAQIVEKGQSSPHALPMRLSKCPFFSMSLHHEIGTALQRAASATVGQRTHSSWANPTRIAAIT